MMLSIISRRRPPYLNRPSSLDLNVAHCFGTHLILNPTNFRTVSHPRFTSSMPDPPGLNWISYGCSFMSAVPLPQNSPAPRTLGPHIYSPKSVSWRPLSYSLKQGSLDPGSLLRIIAWNIDFMALDRIKRALSAVTHLMEVFGDPPPHVSSCSKRYTPIHWRQSSNTLGSSVILQYQMWMFQSDILLL